MLIQRVKEVGEEIVSAQHQYFNPSHTSECIFDYAELSESQIGLGIQRLAQVM